MEGWSLVLVAIVVAGFCRGCRIDSRGTPLTGPIVVCDRRAVARDRRFSTGSRFSFGEEGVQGPLAGKRTLVVILFTDASPHRYPSAAPRSTRLPTPTSGHRTAAHGSWPAAIGGCRDRLFRVWPGPNSWSWPSCSPPTDRRARPGRSSPIPASPRGIRQALERREAGLNDGLCVAAPHDRRLAFCAKPMRATSPMPTP